MKQYSTIRVEKTTRDALDAIGVRRESYNDIILRLLDLYNRKKR